MATENYSKLEQEYAAHIKKMQEHEANYKRIWESTKQYTSRCSPKMQYSMDLHELAVLDIEKDFDNLKKRMYVDFLAKEKEGISRVNAADYSEKDTLIEELRELCSFKKCPADREKNLLAAINYQILLERQQEVKK